MGLIKFGSRVDVLFGPEWEIVVQPGMRVAAGSSVIARRGDFAGERIQTGPATHPGTGACLGL